MKCHYKISSAKTFLYFCHYLNTNKIKGFNHLVPKVPQKKPFVFINKLSLKKKSLRENKGFSPVGTFNHPFHLIPPLQLFQILSGHGRSCPG